MDVESVVEILLHGNQLKRTMRTGWAQRGVPHGENVAAHTYGVGFTTLVLSHLTEEAVDLAKALALAILHDLPEGLTSDIPSPAWRFLPPGIKEDVERAALEEMLDHSPFAEEFEALWQEYDDDESIEAHLVHDADKIDMLLQALVFEEQTGNQHLGEFWDNQYTFYFAASQEIVNFLKVRRESMRT